MNPIAVVEDEADVRSAVVEALERHGFEVIEGSTILDARRLASSASLLLLDLGLPDGDGLALCRELAAVVPIIVISARGDETDRVVALELGADDYLAKPFSTRELVARCRSVLRRAEGHTPRSAVGAADLVTDLDAYRVTRNGSHSVDHEGSRADDVPRRTSRPGRASSRPGRKGVGQLPRLRRPLA